MRNQVPVACLLFFFFLPVRNVLSSLPFAMINATGMCVEDRDNDVLDLSRITHEEDVVYSLSRYSFYWTLHNRLIQKGRREIRSRRA